MVISAHTHRPSLTKASSHPDGALPVSSARLVALLDTSENRQLFDSYTRLVGAPVAVVDLQGSILVSSDPQRICSQLCGADPQSHSDCFESDARLHPEPIDRQPSVTWSCLNGLTRSASPILLDGHHVANAVVGPFFTAPPDEARSREQAEALGINSTDFIAALREVPIMTDEAVGRGLDALLRTVHIIIGVGEGRAQDSESPARPAAIVDPVPRSESSRSESSSRLAADHCQALLQLNRMADASPDALVDFTLATAVRLSRSARGYLTFLDEDERAQNVHWSPQSTAAEAMRSPWTDAIRHRCPIVTYDGEVAAVPDVGDDNPISPLEEGSPGAGHHTRHHLHLPIFDGPHIHLVVGLIDRPATFDEDDVQRLTLLMELLWRLLERKRSQAELAANEVLLRDTFFNIQDAYFQGGLDGVITAVSPSAVEHYGYGSMREMLGLSANVFYANEDENAHVLAELREQGSVSDFLAQARRKDGTRFWASMNARYLRDEQGDPVGVEGFVRDISARMHAEALTRAAEAKYRAAFMTSPDAFYWGTVKDGMIIEVNAQFEALFGYPRDELLGKTALELGLYADPADRARVIAELEKTGKVREFEATGIRKNGTRFIGSLSSSIVFEGGESFQLGVVRDITERKHVEGELAKHRSHLEAMVMQRTRELELLSQVIFVSLEAASVGAWWIRFEEEDTFYALDTTARMLGLPVSSNRSYRISQWTETMRKLQRERPELADQIEHTFEQLEGTITGRYERYRVVYPFPTPGEPMRWIDARADVFSRDRDGKALLMTGTLIDVTRLIEAEKAAIAHKDELEALVARRTDELAQRNRELQKASERLILATSAANIGVWDFDVVNDRLLWDDNMYRLYNRRRPDFPDASVAFAGAIHPEDRLRVDEYVQRELRGDGASAIEFRILWPEGSVRHLQCAWQTFRSPDGRPLRMVGINLDVTEHQLAQEHREHLEEQLRVSQKMEAIGLLAGGIAHDFNNLLSVILSFSTLVMDDLPDGDPRKDDLAEVATAANRAAALTRQLLAFSRKQVIQPTPLNLNQVIAGVEKMLRRILREDIELAQVLDPELGETFADPGQIEQVLLNLVVNARDAITGSGRITIETSNLMFDKPPTPEPFGTTPGAYVSLTVSDTGCGMDKHTLSRIFEPFFTTKDKGKGTGLGLSTVFGIVKQSEGDLKVFSEPGVGSSFKVLLPRRWASSLSRTKPRPPAIGPGRAAGSETVLVVEDDTVLRQVARRVLVEAGYEVLVAADGKEAIALLEQRSGRIDLLLTDVIMPGMSGDALAASLLLSHPHLKVVFMSGYTDDALTDHGVIDAGLKLLTKPFTGVDLRSIVHEVLDRG